MKANTMVAGRVSDDVSCCLATATTAALSLQDLRRTILLYPNDVDENLLRELHSLFVCGLEESLEDDELKDLTEAYVRPEFDACSDWPCLALIVALLVERALKTPIEQLQDEDAESMSVSLAELRPSTSSQVVAASDRLMNTMVFDCRIPHAVGDLSHRNPRRFAQMLRKYWQQLGDIASYQSTAPLTFNPHPLTAYILNLQDRIDRCVDSLRGQPGHEAARASVHILVDALLSSDPDDLMAVPEWSQEHINRVWRFCEETRVHLGTGGFPHTRQEDAFLRFATEVIVDWKAKTELSWKKELERWKTAYAAGNTKRAPKADPKQHRHTIPDPIHVPTAHQIAEICRAGESQIHEFKDARVDVRKLSKEIAGMLNTRRGGQIFCGVNDDGCIVGATQSLQELDQVLQNSVRNTIKPAPAIRLDPVEVHGATVIVVTVPPWNGHDVYQYDGRVLIRKGTNCFPADPNESKTLHMGHPVI